MRQCIRSTCLSSSDSIKNNFSTHPFLSMIRMNTTVNANAACSYYKGSLSKQAEYLKEQIRAYYQGKVARSMGLGEVTKENFTDLAYNIHPIHKGKLTPLNVSNRRVAWDITTLPPKSFSILCALTDDPTEKQALEDAMKQANRAMMLEAEKLILAQNNTQKERFFEETANGLWAEFHHRVGRAVPHQVNGKTVLAGQPLQHIHNLLFSVTYSPKRDKYLAVDPYLVFKSLPYLQSAFHTRLCNQLLKLGYEIERSRDFWEIKGISRDQIERFSERTKEIEQLSKENKITDPVEKGKLGAKSRRSKSKSVAEEQLPAIWKSLLSPAELARLQQIKQAHPIQASHVLDVPTAIDRSLEHFLERNSVAEEKRVIAHAMSLTFGSGFEPELFHAELNNRKNILRTEENHVSLITTQEMVRAEYELLSRASHGKGKFHPLNEFHEVHRDYLNEGQRQAVKGILKSTDGVIALEGKAGSGKTTMLQELSDGLEAVNKQMIAIAPSSKAVDVLRQEGFEQAHTIASFLLQPELQERIRHQVICVDEASLCGIPTLSQVLTIAQEKKARVVLSGNIRQHFSPGEFGDAYRILQQKGKVETFHLDQNMRQKQVADYKEAVDLMAQGKTIEGYHILDQKMEVVHEIPDEEKRIERIAEEYTQSLNQQRSALIISPTNAEKEKISAVVRKQLKAQGKINSKTQTFEQLHNLSFTESQKKDVNSYQEGQSIRFIRNFKGGFRAGQHYEVVTPPATEKAENQVKVREISTGKLMTLPHQTPEQYTVFRKATIELGKGDLIKPTLNLKSKEGSKVNNGTPQQVKGFTQSGDILLENGKTLAKDSYHIAHNYVSTSHASQGSTVQDVYISMTTDSLPAVNQQTLYVTVSRGRSKVNLFTDNKEAVQTAIQRSSERKTAQEVERAHQLRLMKQKQRQQYKELTQTKGRYEPTIQRKPEPERHISK